MKVTHFKKVSETSGVCVYMCVCVFVFWFVCF